MKVFITGGAGFIGANAAGRCLRRKDSVVILDNLSRQGARANLDWLAGQGRLSFIKADIRDAKAVQKAFAVHRDSGLILHLCGQVAVTTSVVNPRDDFSINALGTLNVLEAVRALKLTIPLIYSSTNKVYGGMEDVRIIEKGGRYAYSGLPYGVGEDRSADFHSPYGCSKGAADQYVHDYHRIYGLKTVVFRQSCIYGPRQFGVEDQGWVAWFIIAASLGLPITLYGDGKQVRDVLHIDDLLDAMDAAARSIKKTAGGIYNIGGGPKNILSLKDLLKYIEGRLGHRLSPHKDAWRPGDQRVYVSDIRKAFRDFTWKPRISVRAGLDSLCEWIDQNRGILQNNFSKPRS